METLTTNKQSDTTRQATVLAAESCHFYHRDGTPCYEVPRAKGEGTRPITLADARKLDLVPSVTTILQCAAKPGLEAWKNQQLIQAALTLPKLPDETLDAYAERVIEDSKAQGLKARESGTELHAAIEYYIRFGSIPIGYDQFSEHCCKVQQTLTQHGVDIFTGNAERSFASELGYGGKIDYSHKEGIIVDFKTTASITPKTKPYDEHRMQLAAYGRGIFSNIPNLTHFRALNVFIGIDNQEVRVFEHMWDDLEIGWRMFQHLLDFWYLSKNFNRNAQPK